MEERSFLNWLTICIGLVAVIGFCFTPALAQDRTNIYDETNEEIIAQGDEFEIEEESFGIGTQATWLGCWDFEVTDSDTGHYRFSDRERC